MSERFFFPALYETDLQGGGEEREYVTVTAAARSSYQWRKQHFEENVQLLICTTHIQNNFGEGHSMLFLFF